MPKKKSPPIPPPPPELRLPPAERIDVDPHAIKLSLYLMRDEIDEEKLDALLQSVRTSGFTRSATGMRCTDGTIVLTTGKRLWLVAQRLGCDLPMEVRPEGPLVPVVEALLAHSHEVPHRAFERGRLYRNALREMSRVLGYKVTQEMLSEWLGINPSTVSQCLTIVRNLTPEFVQAQGVDFSAIKRRSQRSLYPVARIRDEDVRAAHLIHLVTGAWPEGFDLPRRTAEERPYSRRRYGRRMTYSILDQARITDAELDELVATIRADVEEARRARRPRAAA